MNTCSRCKQEKPIAEFCNNQPNRCLACNRELSRISRKKPVGQAWIKEYSKKRYQKFKVKAIARTKVHAAVKAGEIIKPTICASCGTEALLQGHHEDYSKPIEVIWLCDPCHKLKHGKLRDLTLIKAKP